MNQTNYYCVICLSANSGLKLINHSNGYDLNYEQKIKISVVELTKYIDNLAYPKYICRGCSGIIELIYQSYKNYYQAKSKLLSHVSKLHKALQPKNVSTENIEQESSSNEVVEIIDKEDADGPMMGRLATEQNCIVKTEESDNETIDFTFINIEEIKEIKQEIDIDDIKLEEPPEFDCISSLDNGSQSDMEIKTEKDETQLNIDKITDIYAPENQQLPNEESDSQTSTFKYVCNLCLETFENEFLLKMHIKLHSKSRRFCCNVCFKKFKNRNSYDFHMKTHMEEKPYECTYCLEKFQNEVLLKTRKKKHNSQKNYSCNICFKDFRFEGYFRTHMNKHLVDALYICDICGQKFSKEPYLTVHMQSHLQCTVCFMNLKEKSLLDIHMKTHQSIC